MSYLRILLLFGVMSYSFTGCMFLSSFQGPYGLPKGETSLGFGASGVGATNSEDSGAAFGLPEVQIQHGVSDRFQLGARAGIGVLGLDAKYQFLKRNKLAVAAGATGSFSLASLDFSEAQGESYAFGTFVPYLTAGTPRLWAGIRGFTFYGGKVDDVNTANLGPGIFLGGELGKGKIRFIPELAIHAVDGDSGSEAVTTFGILMRYKLGR